MSDFESLRSSSPEPVVKTEKKKRKHAVASEDELEIDVNLPEPPSKKAKRKEKKSKSKPATAVAGDSAEKHTEASAVTARAVPAEQTERRSEYGIWIGNLPWSATKESLRKFFEDHGGIDDKSITRIHMPPPTDRGGPRPAAVKPQNKGFAYVDFVGPAELELALALSEKLMVGRRVLIKHAKSFEGRPEPSKEDGEQKKGGMINGKEPSKRIFVGNLGFDITREDLEEHFGQAGQVEDVHMATFQDTGKCKGFAWVRFIEVEGAEAAVKGYVWKKNENGESDEEDEEMKSDSESDSEKESKKPTKKKRKQRKQSKWFINRLHGRPLRCEFAEDAQTRYKKRYGKAPPPTNGAPAFVGARAENDASMETAPQERSSYDKPKSRKPDADQRQEMRRRKHQDARNIAPAKALANAQRASTAIVTPAGKKTTFD